MAGLVSRASEPPPGESAITVSGVSKVYRIWKSPSARLYAGALARASTLPLVPHGLGRRLQRLAGNAFLDFHALKDVSFEVSRGESVGIIGKNGSGKSTLLQIVAGVLTASGGRVEKSGRVAALLELGSSFHPEFTGRDNVYLSALVLGLTAAEIDERLQEIIGFADIGEFIDQPVRTYSTGMLMRLAFSVSVAIEPDILVIDEVLAVGDAGFQFKCLERLDRVIASGATVLFVSHDLVTVKTLCKKALYLVAGECRAFGPTDEVAELYFLDIRNEQLRGARGQGQVRVRPSLREERLVSFGTGEGRIVRASFAGTASPRASFPAGARVEIEVWIEVSTQLEHPCLSLLVLNEKMVPIGGRFGWVEPAVRPGPPGSFREHRFVYSFPATLAAGRYFVTVRLENGASPGTAVLVEKQTAALELEVIRPSTDGLLGFVDLGIRIEQRTLAAAE